MNPTMSENEKKQIIGEIFYNEGYMIDRIKSDNELRNLMTMVVNNLGNTDMENRLSNIILTEIQEKYKQLHPEKQNKVTPEPTTQQVQYQSSNKSIDLSFMINQLRKQLGRIQEEYQDMMADGYIDDEELSSLMKMIKEVISDAYSLKNLATEQSDIQMISAIISSLEQEQGKMKKMQEGIDNINKNKL